MQKGSCLCGGIVYELLSPLRAACHCHCTMCQKQHGAAFATYASVPRADLRYVCGEDLLMSYNSSAAIVRKFCRVCGSNIEWSGSAAYPDWVSIAVATLDTPFKPDKVKSTYLASKACWLASSGY